MKTSNTLRAALLTALLLPATAIAQDIERKAAVRGTHDLAMVFDGDHLRVTGGSSLGLCGIMIGLQRSAFDLPGGARMEIKPLLMLAEGRFDVNGHYEFDLGSLLSKLKEPLVFYVQAISMVDAKGFLTSDALMLGILTMKGSGPQVQPLDEAVGAVAAEVKPLDNGVRTYPIDSSVQTQPLDNGVRTYPIDSSVRTQPLENGVRTYPIDSSVQTQPLDNGVRTYPIDSSVRTQPLDNGVRTMPLK